MYAPGNLPGAYLFRANASNFMKTTCKKNEVTV